MSDWGAIQWTEAAQVASLMAAGAPVTNGASPQAHYDELMSRQQVREAVDFLGHALPRYEGIVWAAQSLKNIGDELHPDTPRTPLMTAIMRWIDDPSDEQRRALGALAEEGDSTDPESLLANAVYFSGGSIAPPDLEPVLPPNDVSARFSTGAVIVAAHRCEKPEPMLRIAADLGTAIAARGLGG